jgi:hypothetical protein
MKVSETYPNTGLYLKAIDHVGQTINATIAAVDKDTFSRPDGTEQTRMVLFFTGQKLGLVLSPSNARTLAEAFGDNGDTWTGKGVIVTTKGYDIEGKKTHGFVLFPQAAPKGWGGSSTTESKAEFNDSIPF